MNVPRKYRRRICDECWQCYQDIKRADDTIIDQMATTTIEKKATSLVINFNKLYLYFSTFAVVVIIGRSSVLLLAIAIDSVNEKHFRMNYFLLGKPNSR